MPQKFGFRPNAAAARLEQTVCLSFQEGDWNHRNEVIFMENNMKKTTPELSDKRTSRLIYFVD